MAGRETAEEKIARIVRQTMASEREAQEERDNPAMGKLQRMIDRSVSGALERLLNDHGDADDRPGRSRQRRSEESDEGDGDLLKLIGLR